jgi:hypothetical protein
MRILLSCATLLILSIGCDKNMTISEIAHERARISLDQFADSFGDADRNVAVDEKELVENYFSDHSEAWMLIQLDNFAEAAHADTVSKYFRALSRPFKSSADLRQAYREKGIRTPFVGICKIVKDQDYFIAELYRSPGPSLHSGDWEKIVIYK